MFIHKPGSLLGPCKTECAHRDCRDNRMVANSTCNMCGANIGYEHDYLLFVGKDEETYGGKFFHEKCFRRFMESTR